MTSAPLHSTSHAGSKQVTSVLPGWQSQSRMRTVFTVPLSIMQFPPFRQPHTSSRGVREPVALRESVARNVSCGMTVVGSGIIQRNSYENTPLSVDMSWRLLVPGKSLTLLISGVISMSLSSVMVKLYKDSIPIVIRCTSVPLNIGGKFAVGVKDLTLWAISGFTYE